MKKNFFLAAAAAMMLSACSFDRDLDFADGSVPEGRIPLKIGVVTANSVVTTRSTDQSLQSTQVDEADFSYVKFGLFVLDDGAFALSSTTSPKDYERWDITPTSLAKNATDGNKTDITVSSGMIYPSDKTVDVNVYAYAPYVSTSDWTANSIDGSTATNKITLAIQADQSKNEDYLKSDVLWGCVGENVTANSTGNGQEISGQKYLAAKKASSASDIPAGYLSDGSVIVPLVHKGAKFVVKLTTDGMPLSALEEAKVSIYTPSLLSTLDVKTGVVDELSVASSGQPTQRVYLTQKLGYTPSDGRKWDTSLTTPAWAADADRKLTTADDDDHGVVVDNSVSTPVISHYICSAVTMPMQLAQGNKLFEIDLKPASGTTYTTYEYKIPSTGTPITKFESGKVYTYTITVKASGLTVTSSVADWTSTTAQGGDATLQ